MADPVYERFDTQEGFQAAVDRLLGEAGRELRIFDPDAAGLRLNDAARVGLLERFLRASRIRRLYMVLHDPQYPQRDCPRMMGLLARYSHAIQIHCTHEEIRQVQDAFLVLDSVHYVRRPVAALPGGAVGLGAEAGALAVRPGVSACRAGPRPAAAHP